MYQQRLDYQVPIENFPTPALPLHPPPCPFAPPANPTGSGSLQDFASIALSQPLVMITL